MLGLDADQGEESFDLTKRFLDLAPGAFPGYSLLTAFGRAAPAQPGLPACESRPALPVPFLEQQPSHERQAEELFLA